MSDLGEGEGDGERGSLGERSEGERETEGVNFSFGKMILDLLSLRLNEGDFGNEIILFWASLVTVAAVPEPEEVSVVMVVFVFVAVSGLLSSSSSSVNVVGSLIVIHLYVYFFLDIVDGVR